MKPTALTRDNVHHTKAIRFWSDGKMAESAYNRLNELRDSNREQDARHILNEWII